LAGSERKPLSGTVQLAAWRSLLPAAAWPRGDPRQERLQRELAFLHIAVVASARAAVSGDADLLGPRAGRGFAR
jgi:hypothetical protein